VVQDKWITLSEALALIGDRLGYGPGRSEAILQKARSSGEVRAIQGLDPIYIGTDEGLIDFNARPGAYNAGGYAYGSRCPATAADAELSYEDLLDWIGRDPANVCGDVSVEKQLRNASIAEIRTAILRVANDPANDKPNVKKLAPLVVAALEQMGAAASQNKIIEVAAEPQFEQLRRTPGKTKRNGA
jgi:hypothetical protein